jgi:hypothetical protein
LIDLKNVMEIVRPQNCALGEQQQMAKQELVKVVENTSLMEDTRMLEKHSNCLTAHTRNRRRGRYLLDEMDNFPELQQKLGLVF